MSIPLKQNRVACVASDTVKPFRLGELFCGSGGLALGAVSAKVRNGQGTWQMEPVWANDSDTASCDTYRKNICPDAPERVICCDVRTLNLDSLSAVDAVAFGFPCNDFSLVGKQKGFAGKFGFLYRYGVQAIDRFKPAFFIAENVEGITSADSGTVFNRIAADLKHAGNGYAVTAHIYKAEEYGVPQTRHRMILVGIDRQYGKTFQVPAPLAKDRFVSVRTALENPPIPSGAGNHEIMKQTETVTERLKYIKPGENIWNAQVPARLKLNVKGAKLSQIYRRLDPDKPSYTITGSGGGGTHGYHWEEHRALTNRERARIQTFPDDFIFEGSKEQVRKQIGMAVPPLLARIVFTAVLKTFAGVPYPYVSASHFDDQPGLL